MFWYDTISVSLVGYIIVIVQNIVLGKIELVLDLKRVELNNYIKYATFMSFLLDYFVNCILISALGNSKSDVLFIS